MTILEGEIDRILPENIKVLHEANPESINSIAARVINQTISFVKYSELLCFLKQENIHIYGIQNNKEGG
jgi:hypothetical protein